MSANQINPYTNINPKYPCPRCNVLFTKTIELYQHIRETHPSPNKCHVCGHYFDAMASLLSHSYLHSGAKPFKCGFPDCNYSTRTKQNIAVHMHFCQQCPLEKFRPAFPLPDRYRSSYKYQYTLGDPKPTKKQNKKPSKPKRKRKTKPRQTQSTDNYNCYSPKRTRQFVNNNSTDGDFLLKTPPTKRYIKTCRLPIKKENCQGWQLEMHKCITRKSQIVEEAIKLISSRLNHKFVRACQPKGLYVAVLRDINNEVQSAAIINVKDVGNYIEIVSFATSLKHSRQNLGTLLIAFILERCNGKIIIGARDNYAVLRFWKSVGFIECSKGIICTFGRAGVVMMQTISPYQGIIDYAITKFAPNSIVKQITIKNDNEIQLKSIARFYKNNTNNNNNKPDQETIDLKNNQSSEPQRKKQKRYHTRYSIPHF